MPSTNSTQIYVPTVFFLIARVLAQDLCTGAPVDRWKQTWAGTLDNKTAGVKPAVLFLQFDI
jgi:hypothetical protein